MIVDLDAMIPVVFETAYSLEAFEIDKAPLHPCKPYFNRSLTSSFEVVHNPDFCDTELLGRSHICILI